MINLHPVDALGEVRAEIAALKLKETALRDQVESFGPGAYEGDLFRATVSVADRTKIDWEAIAQTLKPSLRRPREDWSPQIAELVDGHTTAKPVWTVAVKSRNGQRVAA